MVLQKGDVGFHMGGSCFWETQSDGCYCKKVDFPEYTVIVKIYGVARE